MKTMTGAALAAGALLLAGCGGTSESDTTTATTAAQQSTAPRCERAAKALATALRASLRRGVELERISVVEADAEDAPLAGFRRGAYAVAGTLTGPGMDGQVAIWAVTRDMVKTGGGLALGADAVTREFSELGTAAQSGSPAADFAESVADSDAGRQAIACAEG